MNMTLEQVHQLKKEASALIDTLYHLWMGQVLPVARADPFADAPKGSEKVKRVLDKAHERYTRRNEAWADIKWPWRVEVRAKNAAQALRAIPSEKRAQVSRENGKKGGRPKTKK